MSLEDELSISETSPVSEDLEKTEREKKIEIDEELENFDFQAFLATARRNSTTVRLYSRGDLNYKIALIRNQAMEAMQRGDANGVKTCTEKLEKLQKEYLASYLDIKIEEASKDEQAVFLQKIKAEHGVLGEKEKTLHLIAAQIVEPKGLSGDDLVHLSTVMPVQISELVKAWAELQKLEIDGLPVF